MEKLVTIAERGCIVANTVKNAVDLKITPTLQNPECFRVKASKGEVVVFYFEPLVKQDLKFSGFPKG
jgi:hypothetical protein